ncbi:hypothetical protein [uncultured Photobacterium sp.]|uniref:hypothetical protein n=1 Tax=uncultured Photobacterium sp. TaxID=173973 RepID=UPI002603E9F4|nr:hypothetical protein [uncultured Photobacterium sp.]
MHNLKNETQRFCEFLEFFLSPLGLPGAYDYYTESKIDHFVCVCEELRDTGRLDVSRCSTVDLFHFTNSMIQLMKAFEQDPCLGWGEISEDNEASGLIEVMYIGLGYALIYEEDASAFDTDYVRALAAVARMKYSSFKSTISASALNEDDLKAFVQTRRGFLPLVMYNSEALQDNYKLIYYGEHSHTLRIVAKTLLNRAEWRKVERSRLCDILGVESEEELTKVIVSPENCATVAQVLSLDLDSFVGLLQSIELEYEKAAIINKYKQASELPSKITAAEIKNDEDRITPTEFIELTKSIGRVHPNYKANKKLMGMLLQNGTEIGVEISTTKTVNIWLNASRKAIALEPFIKAEYEQTSADESNYGRHSALRIYNQLSREPVIKLTLKSVGDAKLVINHLK